MTIKALKYSLAIASVAAMAAVSLQPANALTCIDIDGIDRIGIPGSLGPTCGGVGVPPGGWIVVIGGGLQPPVLVLPPWVDPAPEIWNQNLSVSDTGLNHLFDRREFGG